ncbi:MAG: hypothetical protein NCW75_11595 [Phycisphaera sp.]|nr:MAG: hypothetical protein NCW75_11595 [Phycisphaera sp.]
MPDLLTTSQLADRLGLAASTVRKYAQDGMPPAGHMPDGSRLWDEYACRAWLAEHVLDTGHGGRREGAGRKPGSSTAKPWHARPTGAPSMTQQEYNKARAIKETAIANMKVIELRKMQGELLPVDEVRSNWNEALGVVCQALDELPRAVAERVATELGLDKKGWDAVRKVVEEQVGAARARINREAQR